MPTHRVRQRCPCRHHPGIQQRCPSPVPGRNLKGIVSWLLQLGFNDNLPVDRVDTTSPLIETVWSNLLVSSLYLSIQPSTQTDETRQITKMGLTMHLDLITSIGRNLLSSQLGVFKCTSPCAPLTSGRSTVSVTIRQKLTLCSCLQYHSRCRISEGNGKSLNQITAACSHTGPQGEAVILWARSLGENKCSGCFADP
jgi:hypothetical protein